MNVVLPTPDTYTIDVATGIAVRQSDGAVVTYPDDTIDAILKVIHADESLSEAHKLALAELMYHAYKIFRRVEL